MEVGGGQIGGEDDVALHFTDPVGARVEVGHAETPKPCPYPYLWRCSVADPRGSFGNQLLLCRQCGRKERVFRRLHYLVVLFLATAAGGHRHSALRTPHSALRL